MFDEFKKAMTREFEMVDIYLLSYYFGIEIKQSEIRYFYFSIRLCKRNFEEV